MPQNEDQSSNRAVVRYAGDKTKGGNTLHAASQPHSD